MSSTDESLLLPTLDAERPGMNGGFREAPPMRTDNGLAHGGQGGHSTAGRRGGGPLSAQVLRHLAILQFLWYSVSLSLRHARGCGGRGVYWVVTCVQVWAVPQTISPFERSFCINQWSRPYYPLIFIGAGRSCSKVWRGATEGESAGFQLHLPSQEIQQLGQSHGMSPCSVKTVVSVLVK